MENWYALYTKPGWEKKVSEALTKKKITNYCPLKDSGQPKAWWAFKSISLPVFSSQVFVKTTADNLDSLKSCSGVINVCYWLKEPVTIDENIIHHLQAFLDRNQNVAIERMPIKTKINDRNVVFMDSYEGVQLSKDQNKIDIPSLGLRILAVQPTDTFSRKRASEKVVTHHIDVSQKAAI